jgi:hypothetical protein
MKQRPTGRYDGLRWVPVALRRSVRKQTKPSPHPVSQ